MHLAVIPLQVDLSSMRSSGAHTSECASASTNDSSTQRLTGFSSGWGFSASSYSQEALDSTTHDHELIPDEDRRVHVHVDSYTMGVGGYDSWSPNVDQQFILSKDAGLHPCVSSMRWGTGDRDVKVVKTSVRIAPLY